MILGAVNDSIDKLLFLGHMISFVVAFAPAVVNPVLVAKVRADGDMPALGRLAGHLLGNGQQIHFPALVCLGGFGIAMVLTSDEQFGFGDAWVSLAFLVWLALCGIISGAMLPARAQAGRRRSLRLRRSSSAWDSSAVLLVLVMLYLMIWKPGA